MSEIKKEILGGLLEEMNLELKMGKPQRDNIKSVRDTPCQRMVKVTDT